MLATRTSAASDRTRLVFDECGDPSAPAVVLLHGGGQTRHSWKATRQVLAAAGFRVVALDLRGHGDSDWPSSGDYSLPTLVGDLDVVRTKIDAPTALVGASLGGLVALMATAMSSWPTTALVLVDVALQLESDGVHRIIKFMKAFPEGFESLDAAADAISTYLPGRRRPRDLDGLRKNLRLGEDGRWRWHWDPRFVDFDDRHAAQALRGAPDLLADAAQRLTIPTLLVRGQHSDVVSEDGARHFLDLVPQAEYVDVSEARHMVVGDQNDAFTESVVSFLNRILLEGGRGRHR